MSVRSASATPAQPPRHAPQQQNLDLLLFHHVVRIVLPVDLHTATNTHTPRTTCVARITSHPPQSWTHPYSRTPHARHTHTHTCMQLAMTCASSRFDACTSAGRHSDAQHPPMAAMVRLGLLGAADHPQRPRRRTSCDSLRTTHTTAPLTGCDAQHTQPAFLLPWFPPPNAPQLPFPDTHTSNIRSWSLNGAPGRLRPRPEGATNLQSRAEILAEQQLRLCVCNGS